VIGREVVELLWNVADTADPHLNRQLIAYLSVLPLDEDEVRRLVADLLAVFERLAEERPDVVMPFLGRLLNEIQAGET
jgi:hypothetical protein